MATTDITLTRARLMATMVLTGSWAECSLAQAPGMVGDTVGAAAGGAVGATAITDAPVTAMAAAATWGVVTPDVVMQGEGTQGVDTAVVARSTVLLAADSAVGPQAGSTAAAVVVSTAAADTGNTGLLHSILRRTAGSRAASRFSLLDLAISC